MAERPAPEEDAGSAQAEREDEELPREGHGAQGDADPVPDDASVDKTSADSFPASDPPAW